MTISIQEMKDILSEAMQNNTNSNLQNCLNAYYDCIDLYNTMVGNYPLVGFECIVVVPLIDAISSSYYNSVVDEEIEEYRKELEDIPIHNQAMHFVEDHVVYWIEITTEYQNNTIKAFVSAGNGKHELLSEAVDTSSKEAFAKQCEKFVSVL